MMIDAVMYGMIPSANTANWVMRTAREQSAGGSSTPLDSARSWMLLDRAEVDARHRDVGARVGTGRSSAA